MCRQLGTKQEAANEATYEAASRMLKRAPKSVTLSFKEQCDTLRKGVKELGRLTLELKEQNMFQCVEDYPGQQGEMKANIMLAYRHLEDARMRIGKVLQSADDGTSVYDKNTSGQ
ncbi:MAG TPA: hypothetical protein VGB89_12690 [Bacteroidota bacterium]